MFWKTFKSSYESLYTYEDITLKLYIDIANSGNFLKLVKEGEVDSEKCLDAWEQLIKRHEKETGTNQYSAFFQLMKGYSILMNDHTTIRATLILVALTRFFIDWEYIVELKKRGYVIDTTSPETIMASVEAGLRKCENLVTKATMKEKELQRMFEARGEGKAHGFEEIMAHLNFALGFTVPDTIKLSAYNEYQKILKARERAQEEANKKRNG